MAADLDHCFVVFANKNMAVMDRIATVGVRWPRPIRRCGSPPMPNA